MSFKIRPLSDRVVIKRLPHEEKSKGGIIIPDSASEEKGQTGKVIAVGSGRFIDGKIVPMNVKVDDTVVFGKYSGTDVGSDLIIIREEEILGIIES